MSKLVGLHLRHRKFTATHAGYIHRFLLGVLVQDKHTQIISHMLQQQKYEMQKKCQECTVVGVCPVYCTLVE